MLNKVFHIYCGEKCIHHNLNEDSFNGLWEYYHAEGVKVDYEVCDHRRDVMVEASY